MRDRSSGGSAAYPGGRAGELDLLPGNVDGHVAAGLFHFDEHVPDRDVQVDEDVDHALHRAYGLSRRRSPAPLPSSEPSSTAREPHAHRPNSCCTATSRRTARTGPPPKRSRWSTMLLPEALRFSTTTDEDNRSAGTPDHASSALTTSGRYGIGSWARSATASTRRCPMSVSRSRSCGSPVQS